MSEDAPEREISLVERADEIEHRMMDELDNAIITKSVLYKMADGELALELGLEEQAANPRRRMLMGDDPRLPRMPDKPTLLDFFKHRMAPNNHLLQSAALAMKAGLPEKTVLGCLLHDIAVLSFIRADHGYWGAQLIEPYVDEEVTWAVRAHQALRFYPDESVGYTYPEVYKTWFGEDYKPDDYIEDEYRRARDHKWYMTSRLITVFDVYAFDPDAQVALEEFGDIVGRHFKQPKEGLGFDNSPVAHMWRTIMRPTKFL